MAAIVKPDMLIKFQREAKNFSEERGLSDERNIFIYLQSGLEARSYK